MKMFIFLNKCLTFYFPTKFLISTLAHFILVALINWHSIGSSQLIWENQAVRINQKVFGRCIG